MSTEEVCLPRRHQPYRSGYAELREKQDYDPRPYGTLAQLRGLVRYDSLILDVGCGTAYKTLSLARACREFYGLDPSEELLAIAGEETAIRGLSNVHLREGKAEHLPFSDDSIDLVISLLAPHDTAETYRVLKPGGTFYLEKTGAGDKREVKLLFGEDDKGPRGYLCDLKEGDRRRGIEREFRDQGLIRVRSASIFSDCYYPTIEDLVLLLEEVKFTIRDFSAERDAAVLERIQAEYMTERGIRVVRNDIIVIGEKPK